MSNRFLFVSLLVSSCIACTAQIASHANPATSVSSQAVPARQSSTAPAKTTTIQVSGKTQTIPLKLVQTPYFSTYLPTDRFVLDRSSGNDTVKFSWKRADGTKGENTMVGLIFYPKDFDLRSLKQMGDTFALAVWGARKVEQSPAIADAKKTYSSWLRDVTQVEVRANSNVADPRNYVMTAYYGEVKGQVFVVASGYALRDRDEFTAREAIILENLKLKKRG